MNLPEKLVRASLLLFVSAMARRNCSRTAFSSEERCRVRCSAARRRSRRAWNSRWYATNFSTQQDLERRKGKLFCSETHRFRQKTWNSFVLRIALTGNNNNHLTMVYISRMRVLPHPKLTDTSGPSFLLQKWNSMTVISSALREEWENVWEHTVCWQAYDCGIIHIPQVTHSTQWRWGKLLQAQGKSTH